MNKVVVISMVKNEADIIESFVRHCFSFADEILIVDHNSSDATGEILQALQAEGLPLHVKKYYRVELAHAEVMNELLHEAVDRYGADIVLPADADEFLLNMVSEVSCREILQGLDTNRAYQLHWWSVEPKEPEKEQDRFFLYRSCRKGRKFAAAQKMLVGARLVKNSIECEGDRWCFKLVQGCHYGYWQNASGEIRTDAEEFLDNLQVAHFHWRSDAQYMSKVAVSWINNVAKYSENTAVAAYLKNCFDKVSRREMIRPEDFLVDAEDVDFRPYCADQPIRYAAKGKPDVLRNLMQASEAIAEAYAEEKMLRRKLVVSALVLFFGDVRALQQTLENLAEQTYPLLEVLVVNFSEEDRSEDAMRAMFSYQDRFRKLQYLHTGLSETLEDMIQGEYIQWVLPGISLPSYKIWKMLTCMEMFDYQKLTVLMAYGSGSGTGKLPYGLYADMHLDMDFLAFQGSVVWKTLLSGVRPLCGGISAALFRRQTMVRCHWLRECFVGRQFIEILAWEQVLLLPETFVGVLRECMAGVIDEETWLASLVWHQLTLPIFLEKYCKDADVLQDYSYARQTLYVDGMQVEELFSAEMEKRNLLLQHQNMLQGMK